jgi:serine phosphatase RsbU (regulator of sigma subunit)
MKPRKILLVFMMFALGSSPGQNAVIDSLSKEYSKTIYDSTRCRLLIELGGQYEKLNPDTTALCYRKAYTIATKPENSQLIFYLYAANTLKLLGWIEIYYQGDFVKSLDYSNKALEIYSRLKKHVKNKTIQTDLENGIADCYINLGFSYKEQDNYALAIEYYLNALALHEKNDNKVGMSQCYSNLGIVNFNMGVYDKAIDYYLRSLKLEEELKNKHGISNCYNNIGIIHQYQGSLDKALEYFQKSLKTDEEINEKRGIALCYLNIGNVLADQKKNTEALSYYQRSLIILTERGDKKEMSMCYNNIGTIYEALGQYDKAISFFLKSLKIKEELDNKFGMINTYINIGGLNLALADSTAKNNSQRLAYLNKSVEFGTKAMLLAQEINAVYLENAASKTLMDAYERLGNYKKAICFARIFISTKDSLFREEKTKSLAEAESKFKSEKKQLEIDKLNKEKELQQSELSRQQEMSRRKNLYIVFIIFGALVIAAFAVFVMNRLRITRRQKLIIENQKVLVEEKNTLLNEQNDEILQQHSKIEKQKKEITDSINYAKRIQQAVLPSGQLAGNILGEHFVLFKPKAIVSGDFYWATRINDLLLITVADCTGHGVPGAFMSMLGVSFLNEIVRKKEINKASDVLNKLRESVIQALQQKGVYGEQKDGMDIAFCSIDTKTKILHYAGANSPLYIVSAKKELSIFLPDKQPVAYYDHMNEFTNNEIQLNSGDCIYLISDGFEDQFGGPNNKKFLIKNLKELFIKISDKPLHEQQATLSHIFDEWKGKLDQTDDVTILGLRI